VPLTEHSYSQGGPYVALLVLLPEPSSGAGAVSSPGPSSPSSGAGVSSPESSSGAGVSSSPSENHILSYTKTGCSFSKNLVLFPSNNS